MPKLDLIVTHYNEPWETGQKLFDMLTLQRGVNFADVGIIVVQDGPDGALPWAEILKDFPIQAKLVNLKHGGVSRARNAGIEASDAEWVMFCDFDDMFTGVHSLRKFIEAMTPDADMIYSHIQGEQENDHRYRLEMYADNDTFIHGKMFRRQFLIDSHLRFEPDVHFSEDTLFCNVLKMLLHPSRRKEIPEILYTHCWREGSVCRNYENNFHNAVSTFRARKALIREYHDRNKMKNFTANVLKTAFDYYYAITSGGYPNPLWFEEDFWQFWMTYHNVFLSADHDLVMLEHDISFHEAVHKGFAMIPPVTFWQWLDAVRNRHMPTNPPDTDTVHPRIAVYLATRNVYDNMFASLKSLVINSNVQHVYLLIEDDTFPYDVPDFVTVINVSNQPYILPASPNYKTEFTWMPLLRAAFPDLFPQHDVILSLDTDTIILRNIDDIWNTDITNACFAAVKEKQMTRNTGKIYTNIGVCLMNLAKLREDYLSHRILFELNNAQYRFPEQDVYNAFCDGQIMTLPSDYNVSFFSEFTGNPKIIHYAGVREKKSLYFHRFMNEPWPQGIRLKPGTALQLGGEPNE